MEREVMLTGLGGQGVQLAAQVLARAAVVDGRRSLMFGTYLGAMRGGNTDATVVVSDGPRVLSPPIIDRTWAAVAMHHEHWPAVAGRLRPEAVVVVNTSVFEGEPPAGAEVVEVAAVEVARQCGSEQAAAMVAVGALAGATGLVSLPALVEAMTDALPPYRAQHAPVNEAALGAGHQLGRTAGGPVAWDRAGAPA